MLPRVRGPLAFWVGSGVSTRSALFGLLSSPRTAIVSFGGGCPLVVSLPFSHGRYRLFDVICGTILRAINLALLVGCALELCLRGSHQCSFS
jgi:hypothetical protein